MPTIASLLRMCAIGRIRRIFYCPIISHNEGALKQCLKYTSAVVRVYYYSA